MNKTSLYVLMFLILVSNLIGCSNNGATKDVNTDYEVFMAKVISSEEGLLVTPDKDSIEASSSDKISVSARDAEITDNQGNEMDIDVLKPGDRIKIFYNGMIAESYPAQITADKIELVGHNYIIDGFITLIDDIYQEDSGLNGDITMIAFDTTDWTMLTEIETEIILALVKVKYELEVVVGTFDELAEQGLIDKDNLYFEDGILIEIKDIEINKDKDKIECSIKKWRSGLGAIGWDAKAKLNKDTWEITRGGMWIS